MNCESLRMGLSYFKTYAINEDGLIMPLVKGKAAKSRKGFSENVKREMEAGKPQKQAVAIAYSEADKSKKKSKKGKK